MCAGGPGLPQRYAPHTGSASIPPEHSCCQNHIGLYCVLPWSTLDRKAHPQEGSYTCYLFDKGLDKILKKVGRLSIAAVKIILVYIAFFHGQLSLSTCFAFLTKLSYNENAQEGYAMDSTLEALYQVVFSSASGSRFSAPGAPAQPARRPKGYPLTGRRWS